MISAAPDLLSLFFVVLGAFVSGFVTGFAGFGTGLVASGFWLHALPAPMVPPIVAITSVAAQFVSFTSVRKSFDWRRVTPFLLGGAVGVPFGVLALSYSSPNSLRFFIGIFLVTYSSFQLLGLSSIQISPTVNRTQDGIVGIGGGFLGGFAGLSGPIPLIWLQLKGGASDKQRAIYQPFNLIILVAASMAMIIAGQVGTDVWVVIGICLPATIVGSIFGSRIYKGVSEKIFRSVVLVLLLISGIMLIAQIALT